VKIKIEDCYEKIVGKIQIWLNFGQKFRRMFLKTQVGCIVAGEITGP